MALSEMEANIFRIALWNLLWPSGVIGHIIVDPLNSMKLPCLSNLYMAPRKSVQRSTGERRCVSSMNAIKS
jgi:hypothetical protein